MIKIINIILFLFVLTSHLKAEIVNNIVIEGNKRVNEETIKIYGDIKVNKNYNDKDLNQILLTTSALRLVVNKNKKTVNI